MWIMIITLGLSALLLCVFIILITPRPKYRSLGKAFTRLKESARLAEKLSADPDIGQLKKLNRLLNICEFRLQDVVDNGLVEVKSVARLTDEANDLVKSLIVVKAPPETISKHSGMLLAMLGNAINKLIPFAKIYKSNEIFNITAKSRAASILAKYDSPELPPKSEADEIPPQES